MTANNNSIKVVATNKKASFLYNLIQSYESGISLLGSEVKAVRENKANIKDFQNLLKKMIDNCISSAKENI